MFSQCIRTVGLLSPITQGQRVHTGHPEHIITYAASIRLDELISIYEMPIIHSPAKVSPKKEGRTSSSV
jgi:hypothetical protein